MTDEERRRIQRERVRAWRAANPERERANVRAWKAANPEKESQYQRTYRERHHERLLIEEKAWRVANPDKVHAQNHRPGAREARRLATAKWRKENLERSRTEHAERESRRRAVMRGSETEPVDRNAIIARDKSRCHLCGKRVAKKDIQIDHLIPLSRGGPHTAANLAVAHRSCNAKKWANAANDQLRLVG